MYPAVARVRRTLVRFSRCVPFRSDRGWGGRFYRISAVLSVRARQRKRCAAESALRAGLPAGALAQLAFFTGAAVFEFDAHFGSATAPVPCVSYVLSPCIVRRRRGPVRGVISTYTQDLNISIYITAQDESSFADGRSIFRTAPLLKAALSSLDGGGGGGGCDDAQNAQRDITSISDRRWWWFVRVRCV